jgi:broad specificity phosphatase PhoE
MPAQMTAAVERLREEDIETQVRVSSDLNRHIDWLQQCAELGFKRLYLHNVNREQRAFIEAFGERVLPAFSKGG